MYNVIVAPLVTQSFQKFEVENFLRITKEYPTLQMEPDRATIPAAPKQFFTIFMNTELFITISVSD